MMVIFQTTLKDFENYPQFQILTPPHTPART